MWKRSITNVKISRLGNPDIGLKAVLVVFYNDGTYEYTDELDFNMYSNGMFREERVD